MVADKPKVLPSPSEGKEKSKASTLQGRVVVDLTNMGVDGEHCALGLTKAISFADVVCMRTDAAGFLLIKLKADEAVSRNIKVKGGVASVLYCPRPAGDLHRTVIATYESVSSVSPSSSSSPSSLSSSLLSSSFLL